MNGLLGFPTQELMDIPSVPSMDIPSLPSVDIPEVPGESTLKAVALTLLVFSYFKLLFPIVLTFTLEAQNITFRQLLFNTKNNKWPVPVLGYLLTLGVLSLLASYLGYLVQQYVLPLWGGLIWFVLALFLFVAIFNFVRVDKLWKGRDVDHGEALLAGKGDGRSFGRVVLDILKVQGVEITQKAVLLLAATSAIWPVLIEALIAYLVLAILAVTVGTKLGESTSQNVFQLLSGAFLILWIVPFVVEAILLSLFSLPSF